jgi:hypothetical protein
VENFFYFFFGTLFALVVICTGVFLCSVKNPKKNGKIGGVVQTQPPQKNTNVLLNLN